MSCLFYSVDYLVFTFAHVWTKQKRNEDNKCMRAGKEAKNEENKPCSIKSQFKRLTSITLKWHEKKRMRNKSQVNEKWQKQLRRQPCMLCLCLYVAHQFVDMHVSVSRRPIFMHSVVILSTKRRRRKEQHGEATQWCSTMSLSHFLV